MIIKTPVQKSTIHNYFKAVTKSEDTATTSARSEGEEVVEVLRVSGEQFSGKTISTFNSKLILCPGCRLSIPRYSLNDHLDTVCSSREVPLSKEEPEPADKSEHMSTVCSQLTEVDVERRASDPFPKRRRLSYSEVNVSVEKSSELINLTSFVKEKTIEVAPELNPAIKIAYYLENFLFAIKSVLSEPVYQHLFNEEDINYWSTFESLTLNAQKLYVRLFTRKFQWRRVEKIVYEDISKDLTNALSELGSSNLLENITSLDDLPTLLKMLTQPEIKQLCKDMKVSFSSKGDSIDVII